MVVMPSNKAVKACSEVALAKEVTTSEHNSSAMISLAVLTFQPSNSEKKLLLAVAGSC